MNFSPIESPLASVSPNTQTDFAARQTALQFETLFLKQLTAALSPTAEEGEDNLFSSTGADMYKQMFSEHIAQVMANSGGIGIADTILRQLREKAEAKNPALERAIEAAKSLQEETPVALAPSEVLQAEVSEARATSAVLRAPLAGRITSGFGLRNDPLNGKARHHHGIDIAAARGTPIGAAASGTVVFAGRRGGYGNTVIIEQADGRQTLYGHADQLLVSVGEEVAAGQQIATVGSTGRSTGAHLHFEVRENGQAVNPVTNYAKDFVLPDR